MGHHAAVTRLVRHVDGVEGFRERADLIDLDEDRVCDPLADAAPESLRVGHEQVVADELHPLTETLRDGAPAVPIVFRKTVFDRDDRIRIADLLVKSTIWPAESGLSRVVG